MNENIVTINTIELASINDIVHATTTITYEGVAQNQKRPIVICGRCGAEEQYISLNQTICPNCNE